MNDLKESISAEEIENLEVGFKQPFEIKNGHKEGYTTEIKGIEFWAPVNIEGYEHYWVSTKGRVWNSKSKRLLKGTDCKGYQQVCLVGERDKEVNYFHRIVALTFTENPENKPEVNHKDGNKSNNSVQNLEWVTTKENMQHARKTGLIANNITKQQEEQFIFLRKQGKQYSEISKITKVSPPAISKRIKRYVEENEGYSYLLKRIRK